MYLCVTKGAAEWMISKPKLMDVLHQSVVSVASDNISLAGKIFAEGPFRLALDTECQLLTIWNVDYLSGTGEESVGFVKLSGEFSLLSQLNFSREAFERALYLINQRLHGLLIEGAFLHRKHSGNIHTLLAGRGTEARQFSLGYYDVILGTSVDYRTIIINGPSDRFQPLVDSIEAESKSLLDLIDKSSEILVFHQDLVIEEGDILEELRKELKLYFSDESTTDNGVIANSEVKFNGLPIRSEEVYKAFGYTYNQWIDQTSPLSEVQRKILQSDSLDIHPIRIIGPAGSGKTLLMQLLAGKKFSAIINGDPIRIAYLIHNDAMKNKVLQGFQLLFPQIDLGDYSEKFVITTLSEYCRSQLQLDIEALLDRDASEAREFQVEMILELLKNHILALNDSSKSHIRFLSDLKSEASLQVLAGIIMTEISVAIKGNGLQDDRNRYVNSERNLSILHGQISTEERNFIFDIFEQYNTEVFYHMGVMDPDDLAISLYGRLKTPLWTLQRRDSGFDYIFVDEAQLFSENEKRVFPLLSKVSNSSVPIALALDEAQSLYGGSTAGYSALGIKDISNRSLNSIHRSSREILQLAFFILQRSTNLFSVDFPDFTKNDFIVTQADTNKIKKPRIEHESPESPAFSKFVLRRIRELRKSDIRSIAIVCHSDTHWKALADDLMQSDLPFQILRERGEKIRIDQPHVVLCRPAQIGGQEFEAVIVVGLESGSSGKENVALASAIEQQLIRELYLSITRAKFQVIFTLSKFSRPHEVLRQATEAQYIASGK